MSSNVQEQIVRQRGEGYRLHVLGGVAGAERRVCRHSSARRGAQGGYARHRAAPGAPGGDKGGSKAGRQGRRMWERTRSSRRASSAQSLDQQPPAPAGPIGSIHSASPVRYLEPRPTVTPCIRVVVDTRPPLVKAGDVALLWEGDPEHV